MLLELIILNCMKIHYLTILSEKDNVSKSSCTRNSTFTILWRKLTISEQTSFSIFWFEWFWICKNSVKFLLQLNIVLLQLIWMSEHFLLHFVDLNLMPSCKHKDLLHYRENWILFRTIYKCGVLGQNGSTPHIIPIYGTNFLNPMITTKNYNSQNCVLDARHLNPNFDQSFDPWTLANGNFSNATC